MHEVYMSTHSCCGCSQILRKPDGSSRGFGFVTYSDEKAVEQCLVMQHEIGGKAVRNRPQPGHHTQILSAHQMSNLNSELKNRDRGQIWMDLFLYIPLSNAVVNRRLASGGSWHDGV